MLQSRSVHCNKIVERTVSGVFYLCDVLKLVVHGLYKCTFSQANLVSHTHERVSHIVLDFCDELYPIYKEAFKKSFPIYPLSPKSFPLMFLSNASSLRGSLSSTPPVVNTKFRIFPLSLIIKYNLNPKNHSKEHFPRLAKPSKVLWIWIRWLRHTRRGGLSTKLIPVHSPNKTCLIKTVSCRSTSFSNSTKRLYDTVLGNISLQCLQI